MTDHEKRELTRIADKIVKAVRPDEIICFGVRTMVQTQWSCFSLPDHPRHFEKIIFDLLIFTGDAERRNHKVLMHMVRRQSEPGITINCVVHKRALVLKYLLEGDAFFHTIYKTGIPVYKNVLAKNGYPATCNTLSIEDISRDWNRYFGQAQEFLQTALDALKNNRTGIAALLLHQAVEHACRALIRAYTGHRYSSHNLSHLLALVDNFSFGKVSAIFPCSTTQEWELFETLQRAYSARYKDDYTVDLGNLFILAERVHSMHNVMEALCKCKVASFDLSKVVFLGLNLQRPN